MSKNLNGFSWNIAGTGIGWMSNNKYIKIEVCEKEHPLDYKIVSDWISKIE